ncbi:unnamed protein product, partial [marine sediment metagenome]
TITQNNPIQVLKFLKKSRIAVKKTTTVMNPRIPVDIPGKSNPTSPNVLIRIDEIV